MTYIPPAGGEIGIGPETVWTSPDVLIANEIAVVNLAATAYEIAIAAQFVYVLESKVYTQEV